MSLGTGIAVAGLWIGIGMAFLGLSRAAAPGWEVIWSLLGTGFSLSIALALLGPSRSV